MRCASGRAKKYRGVFTVLDGCWKYSSGFSRGFELGKLTHFDRYNSIILGQQRYKHHFLWLPKCHSAAAGNHFGWISWLMTASIQTLKNHYLIWNILDIPHIAEVFTAASHSSDTGTSIWPSYWHGYQLNGKRKPKIKEWHSQPKVKVIMLTFFT